jgi:hypothetical protein
MRITDRKAAEAAETMAETGVALVTHGAGGLTRLRAAGVLVFAGNENIATRGPRMAPAICWNERPSLAGKATSDATASGGRLRPDQRRRRTGAWDWRLLDIDSQRFVGRELLHRRREQLAAALRQSLERPLQSIAQSPASECPHLCLGCHRLDSSLQRRAFLMNRGDHRSHRHTDIDQYGFGQLEARLDRVRYRVRSADAIEVRRMCGIASARDY